MSHYDPLDRNVLEIVPERSNDVVYFETTGPGALSIEGQSFDTGGKQATGGS